MRGFRWLVTTWRAQAFVIVIAAWLVAVISAAETPSVRPVEPAPSQALSAVLDQAVSSRSVLDQYCVACHNQRMKSGGVALDAADVAHPSTDAALWERVIRKLRTGTMPPGNRPRPDLATYHAVTGWLESEIDRAALKSPNPGRSNAVHRLNRTEYRNAIRDLLKIEVNVASLLPAEDTSDSGFDNNADLLSIAPAQLERYLSASRVISRLATGIAPVTAGFDAFTIPLHLMQDDRTDEELPLGARGGMAVRYYFPSDADYSFRVKLRRTYVDYVQGMGNQHQLDIRVDGVLAKRFVVGGGTTARPAPDSFAGAGGVWGDPLWEKYLLSEADAGLEVTIPVKAGPRVVTASFVRKMRQTQGIFQKRRGGSVLSNSELYDGNAAVDTVEIGGPYKVTGPGDTPSRREVFICSPAAVADEVSCATQILSKLARRAYRRPVTSTDLAPLLQFFTTGRQQSGNFDGGIQFALERLLVDPEFLLRIHRQPARAASASAAPLDPVELASRLSFFVWSSIPDDELLGAAESGRLNDPAVLEQQVRRLLADRRSRALVENFAAQWLHLRKLDEWASDTVAYGEYDDNLRLGFRQETELFIESTMRDDRSVLELLSADYTFVNERLARHYGIPGVYGSRFRRVKLPDLNQRGGILGHGGLLMLSSYPNRTSPVLRGKWLLDSILGAPPPSPPENVPDLPERGPTGKVVSVRHRLETHRSSPNCASCHSTIDPLGFALEHYDGLGAWRTHDEGGNPVDASGTMPNGARVDGLAGLRGLLLNQREQFVSALTEKLLAYAIGRGLDYYDQPTIRRIVREAEASEYRWSALLIGVVKSPAFRQRAAASN